LKLKSLRGATVFSLVFYRRLYQITHINGRMLFKLKHSPSIVASAGFV
jgi:hypothetical protein